jgi:hypothetical protein
MMKSREMRIQALRAGVVREHAQRACSDLCAPGFLRRRDDQLARARLIHAALTTRLRFKRLYERSKELQAALERFKRRRVQAGEP